MSDTALQVDNLHKRYSSVQALRGLSFTVPRGAFFGLFGRNGAGKTTALDIAAGLRLRDAGHVTLLGSPTNIEPEPAVKARYAYVAGHLRLLGWMTCRRHIDFVRAFYPTWDAQREHALGKLLAIPMDERVGYLSPGQHMQLQLLMALARHPELLIVDEPGNLDVVVRRRLMASMIDAIASLETTVVMASHIISELEGVCDHVCIIDQGGALASGPTETLTERFRHVRLTGRDVRQPEANRWPGIVSSEVRNGEVSLVVSAYTAGMERDLASALNAECAEVERLGIEDIFVALTGSDG